MSSEFFGVRVLAASSLILGALAVNLGATARQTSAVKPALKEMRSEQDPLAGHIFVSRRQFRETHDTKSGKRREINARLSWQQACELGFRGDLTEWERLMGAVGSGEPVRLKQGRNTGSSKRSDFGQIRTLESRKFARSCKVSISLERR